MQVGLDDGGVAFPGGLAAAGDDDLLYVAVEPGVQADALRDQGDAIVQAGEQLPQMALGLGLVAPDGEELAMPLAAAVTSQVQGGFPGTGVALA